MIYNIGRENKIRILGQTFVKNNIWECHLTITGKTKELTEQVELNKEQMSKKSIMLKLIGIKNVINMSGMFSGCYSLNNLPDISKWKTSKLTYYTYYNDMFNECKKIKQTPKMK